MDIERLDNEIYTVQIVDNYLINGKLKSDDEFFRDSIDKSYFGDESMYDEYMDDVEDEEYNDDYKDTIEDVMEILIEDLEVYSDLYKIPELSITNDEWDLFFDTIYEYYESHSLSEFYFLDMVDVNKFAMAKSLVYEQKSISLNTYISALKYMESAVLNINDIKEIINILEDRFNQGNLLSLIANPDGSFGNYGKEYQINEVILGKSCYFEDSSNIINQGNDSFSTKKYNNIVEFPKVLGKKK